TTVVCTICGTRIWNDDNAGNADIPLCEDCRCNHYTTCYHCGRLIHNDDAYYETDDDDDAYCCDCYDGSEHSIHDYSYKPNPIFYGGGGRYFGIELEIDGAGENCANADRLLELANTQGELIYIKHDGSLDDGMELVTHPMTAQFQQKEMPWAAVMQAAISMGYTSHQAHTCGLHLHVNRSTFGTTQTAQDAAIARVLYFFEKHWEELLKFSRRTQRQLDRWAARYGYKDRPMDILDHAKNGYGSGRYSAVNLQNRDTIEFRMFRGTLKYNTLIATLQLVNRVCDVAIFLSDEDIKAMPWTTFVAGVTEPELIAYLKERRLYINEEVTVGEEI
ncbi:MAG: amidoligase family protein, partial [Oscillospiraceae bacterium]